MFVLQIEELWAGQHWVFRGIYANPIDARNAAHELLDDNERYYIAFYEVGGPNSTFVERGGKHDGKFWVTEDVSSHHPTTCPNCRYL